VSRLRLPFLPTFLTLLGVAFAVVVAARIRSYNGGGAGGAGERGEVSSTISGPQATSRYAPGSSASPSSEETGGTTTIATVGTKSSPASGNAKLSAREQRYRELLNSQPPAAAPAGQQKAPVHTVAAAKPPEKPQSAIAKIGQQIKNFFGGNSTPPPPPQQPQPSRPNPDTPRDKPVDKDPSTDTTPPSVTAVQFDPASVHDGDSVAVIVTAMDDMSGIRGISGTITSPNGKALQGFACQREAPDSNRYIGRLTIPKDAEEGLWHINFLNVSDNASNSVTLAYNQAPVLQSAQLQVTSSRSDKTPPTVKAAWIDKRGMRAGEKNTLFVQALDDKSGVNLVSGVFLSPRKQARIGVACRGNGDGDLWTCDFTVPTCLDCGDWQLEQIQLQDKASNMTAVTAGASDIVRAVVVNIVGDSCDGEPPVLQAVMLETNQVPSTPDGTLVNVRAAVNDDGCGVASVSGQVVGPSGGSGLFFAFSSAGGQEWIGKMPIPRLAGKGVWKINWLQVMDKGNNLRVYFSSDPLLRNAFVNVR
jgi:hypothetical protein